MVKFLPEFESLKGITIRDILNHTSGVTNYTDQESFWQLVDYNKSLSLDNILNFIAKLPFDFSPKANWKYSNSGYIIAGKIIEVVSGQSWDGSHISFTRHAREELKNDNLTTVDAVNVLASTDSRITDKPEFKNDIWRYRVKTNKICVVISFYEDHRGFLVITVFKINRSSP